MSKQLIEAESISSAEAREMIEMFTQAGEHHLAFRFRSPDDVIACFKQNGYDFAAVVEECRDPRHGVPMFENLLGSKWTVGAGHVIITDVHLDGTAQQQTVEESQDFTLSRYARLFEAAAAARRRAIDNADSDEIETAFIKGVVSIEAFLNAQAANWNAKQGTPELIDSLKKRLSIETKINQWIPRITAGRSFDKTTNFWTAFKQVRDQRNEEGIHPKTTARIFSVEEIANHANLFRFAIAGMLVQLHLTIPLQIPSPIIRSLFAPDVSVVNT